MPSKETPRFNPARQGWGVSMAANLAAEKRILARARQARTQSPREGGRTMLRLLDEATGQIIRPEEFDPKVYEDEALMAADELLGMILKDLGQLRTQIQNTVAVRMHNEQATLLVTDIYEAALKATKSYQYNLADLVELRKLITGDEWNRAVKTELKPNKTELNKLVKRGGQIKAIIERSVIEMPGAPKLEIKRTVDDAPAWPEPPEVA